MWLRDLCDVAYVLRVDEAIRETAPLAEHVEVTEDSGSWLEQARAAVDRVLLWEPSEAEIAKAVRLRRIDEFRRGVG